MYLLTPHILRRFWLFLGATSCVLKSRFFTHRPFFISHVITSRCFAKCPTCLWRGQSIEQYDTTKIIKFYQQARNLGFVSTTIWGGEPLLREDLFEILGECKKLGMIVGIITNGYLLPQYYELLSKYLDFLIVSIDIPDEKHDQLRGVPGMFNNLLFGLKQIRGINPYLKVFINSVVSELNYKYVRKLIDFAEDLSLSITFESVNQGPVEFPRQEGKTVVDLRLSPEKEREVFNLIYQLKKKHSSINNSRSYLKLFKGGEVRYICHAPEISIRVYPDGSVVNCQDRTRPIGNVFEENLVDIIFSPQMKRLQKKAHSCSQCVDSGVIESSLFWNINFEVMANSMRLFIK